MSPEGKMLPSHLLVPIEVARAIAIMSIARRWGQARSGMVVAESRAKH